MWAADGRETGTALLIVLGACAAMASLTTWMLVVALSVHQAGGYRGERAQADLLARAAIDQCVEAIAAGRVLLPERRSSVVIVNGALEPDGGATTIGLVPGAAAGVDWPRATSTAWAAGGAEPDGVGTRVEIRAVVGPRGESRGRCLDCGDERLYAIVAEAWYRRGLVRRSGRVVVARTGEVVRVD